MTEKQKNDVVGKKECTDAAARDPSAGPLPFCNDAWNTWEAQRKLIEE